MALIKCPECGKELSDKASVCVNCGYPIGDHVRKNEEKKKVEEQRKKEEEEIRNKFSCPSCGTQNKIGTDYCVKCGRRLTEYKSVKAEYKTVDKNSLNDRKPFYMKTWFIAIMCIFFPPIGILFLWVYNKPNNKYIKTVLTVFLSFYTLIWFASSLSSFIDDSRTTKQEETVSTYKEEKEDISNDLFSKEMELFESGEYNYISTEDLEKYHSNMSGVKFYTVTDIDDMDDLLIQSTICDGYMMSNFNLVEKCPLDLKTGEYVSIMGEVGDYTDYGSVGKSIDFNNCYVFAVGSEAQKYQKQISDDFFSQYFEITEGVANSYDDLGEEEFKSLCEQLSHNDIMRNPDLYENKYCLLKGTVSQVIEGFFGGYTIYIEDTNGNMWGCTYIYKEGESRVLEGDKVIAYGICNGTETTETVLGKQVTIPYVEIEYIE